MPAENDWGISPSPAKAITADDGEIREALSKCVSTIVSAIRVALERTPPELSADISDRGIVPRRRRCLTENLDKRIREETGLPVCIADDPLCSVVLGTGKILSNFKLLRKISVEWILWGNLHMPPRDKAPREDSMLSQPDLGT